MTKQEKSWILYDWANSVYSIVITTAILPLYFKDVVTTGIKGHLSTAYWGYANSIATIILLFLAPILGAMADYKNLKKKFLLFFLCLGILSTTSFSTITYGQWLLCLIAYAVSVIGFSGANIFYDSFLVDVTSKKRMDWISASGYAWGYIGSSIPFAICIILILNPSIVGLGSYVTSMRFAFIISAFWWLIFSVPIIKNVQQKYYIEPTLSKNLIIDSIIRVLTTLKNIKQHKNIFLFLIAYFFYIDGVSTVIKMAAVYGRDIGINTIHLLLILLGVQVLAFPFALLYGKLANKYSAKKMILTGIIIYIFISFFAYFLKTTFHYCILGLLVASSQGGIQALSRSFFGKIIPKEKSAEFFGFFNVFGKFIAILGPFVVAFISHITETSRLGVLSLIAFFIIGGILLLKVKSNDYVGS